MPVLGKDGFGYTGFQAPSVKQSYLSEHYDLEDRVLKYYPQTIKEYEERIAGYENDAALAEQHKPQG